MYADRANGGRFSPASLALGLGINAALLGALLYANPDIIPVTPRKPLVPIDYIPEPVPPPDPAPKPEPNPRSADPAPRPQPRPDVSEAPITTGDPFVLPPPLPQPPDPGPVAGTGEGAGPVAPPAPPPVMIGPATDARYADDYQPPYPADERRAGNEGRVVARVLVGVDGRVKRIERVSATSEAFWRATEDRAMRRWRFRPGTRDGVPVEAWRTMALTFRLED